MWGSEVYEEIDEKVMALATRDDNVEYLKFKPHKIDESNKEFFTKSPTVETMREWLRKVLVKIVTSKTGLVSMPPHEEEWVAMRSPESPQKGNDSYSFGYFKYNADNNYKKIWEYGMHKSNGKVFTISLPTTFRDFLYTYDVTENEEFEDEIDNSPIYVLRDESLLKNLSTKWKVDHEGTLPDNLVAKRYETKIRQQDDAGNLMFDGKRQPLYMDRYVWGTLDKTGKTKRWNNKSFETLLPSSLRKAFEVLKEEGDDYGYGPYAIIESGDYLDEVEEDDEEGDKDDDDIRYLRYLDVGVEEGDDELNQMDPLSEEEEEQAMSGGGVRPTMATIRAWVRNSRGDGKKSRQARALLRVWLN